MLIGLQIIFNIVTILNIDRIANYGAANILLRYYSDWKI